MKNEDDEAVAAALNKSVPWSIKGIGFDAREAAKDAARRAGLTVGEWLQTVIAERASESGVHVEDIGMEDQLEAVTARLARLSDHGDGRPARRPARSSRRPGHDADDESPYRAARDEEVAQRRRRQDVRRGQDEAHRPFDDAQSEDLLDEAVKIFESRQRHHALRTEEALGKVARRLSDIESHIGSRDESETARALRNAVEQLEERVDQLTRRKGDPATAQALREIEAQLVRLSEKQESAARSKPVQPPAADAPGGEHLLRIEEKLNRLISSLSEPSEVVFPAGRGVPSGAGQEAVAEILLRQKMLDRAGSPPMRSVPEARDALTPPVYASQPQGSNQFDAQSIQSGISSLSEQLQSLRRDSRSAANAVANPDVEFLRLQVSEIGDVVRGLAQREPPLAVERAIQDLTRRVDESRDHGVGTNALASIEKALAEIRRAYEAMHPKLIAEAMQEELRHLHERLDAMRIEGFDRDTFQALKRKTDEIGNLLAQVLARPMPTEALERQVAALSEKVDLLAARPEVSPYLIETLGAIRDSIDRVDSNPALRDIETRMTELANRTGELPPALFHVLDEMRQSIDSVAANPALRAVQKQVTDLASRTGDLPAKLLDVLADLQRSIENVSANPGLRAIEAQVAELAAHSGRIPEHLVETLHDIRSSIDRMAGNAGVSAIEEKLRGVSAAAELPEHFVDALDQMRQSIERMSLQPGLHTIETQVADLARKVESAITSPPAAAETDKIFDRIADLHGELMARIDSRAADHKLPEVEGRIAELSQRIDDVHRAVVDQVKTPTDPDNRLRDMVAQLAEKIERVGSGHGDTRALQALENQVTRLAERLEGAGETAESIGALERAMGELFAQLEETRHAAIEAAEAAARDAVRGVAVGGAAPEAVVREISELRTLQDESDRRTHSTLTAVHETLEKVVDRLALLEDDLGDVRTQRDFVHDEPIARPAASRSVAQAAPAVEVASVKVERVEAVEEPTCTAPAPAPKFDVRAAMQVGSRAEPDVVLHTPDVDVLIEPGSGFAPSRRGAGQSHDAPSTPRAAQASFIAAARRAAQTASPEQTEVQSAPPAQGAPVDAALAEARARARAAATGFEKVAASGGASVLKSKARPILLSIAGLFLLVGALQIARTMMDSPAGETAPVEPLPKLSSTAVPPRPVASLQAPRVAAASPADAREEPAQASRIAPPADVDPISTASIPKSADASPNLVELATAGNVAAQFELGSRYVDGRGVKRDPAIAAEWFRKAAEKDHAPSQYRLGSLYEKGIGVERSSTEAAGWYRRAADAGNIRAMHNLAVLLAEGLRGKPDYAAAVTWFRNAAEHGVRDSQYNLAILYARGLGVTTNLVKSYMWFALAAAQGDADALKKRDEIAARLAPRQLAEAKVAADTFALRSSNHEANESASVETLINAPRAETRPPVQSPSATAPRRPASSGKSTARVSSL